MSTEHHKQLIERLYTDVFNQHQPALVEHLAVADYVEHAPLPGQREGRAGLLDRTTMITDGLSPQFTIDDVVAEGDRVAVRWTNSGIHSGEFLGIPPTGRTYQIAGIDIYRIQAGLLAEHWHVIEEMALMQQLGLLPSPQAGGQAP
jgi:predicted ester cyclase